MNQNFTSIDHIINQPQPVSVEGAEKQEPIGAAHLESPTAMEVHIDEQDEKRNQEYIAKHVEEKIDLPEIPPDVAAVGVQATSTTLGVTPEIIELPLPDAEIPGNLKKPVSSGLRWLAEISVYMLKKVHLKLKEVHGKIVRVKE